MKVTHRKRPKTPRPNALNKRWKRTGIILKGAFCFYHLICRAICLFCSGKFIWVFAGPMERLFQFDLGEFNGELVRLVMRPSSILYFRARHRGADDIVVLFTQGTLSGRINFAPKAMNFKGSRINPLQGLKRMVSMKALVEMLKSIAKVVFLVGVTYLVISAAISALLTSSDANLLKGLERVHATFIGLFIALLLVLAAIALLDVLWQRHQHIQQLRMSRQDIKDEHKQTEGSPEVKAKIRRMQMTTAARAAKQRKALDDVPSATAVITNPHFAIALKYDVGAKERQQSLLWGEARWLRISLILLKLICSDFPKPFACSSLVFHRRNWCGNPRRAVQCCGCVLAFIFRIANGENLEAPEIEVPEDLQFNETGERYNA